MTDGIRVVVVGAGFSGLAAAQALTRAGAQVRVLEARDRVGGRALTRWLPELTQLDLGAQWIGPTQDRMYALVAEHGLATFASAAVGAPTLLWAGQRRAEPPAQAGRVLSLLDEYAARLDPAAPWQTPEAAQWDRTILGGWLATTAGDGDTADYLGRLLAGGLLATSADELSLLHLLFYLRSAGGTGPLLGMAGGAQQDRIVGGPPALAERMAAALPPGTLTLATPVRAIEQTIDGVTAWTDTGRVDGDAMVVALAPALAGRIRYDPPLPALRDGLTQRMPMGTALKVHAVYPEPFWRADGFSGVATSSAGPLTETVDNSTPTSPLGVLTGFSYSSDAAALREMSPGQRRRCLLDAFAALVGPGAGNPMELVEYDWSAEEWTRGCFSGALTPGTWSTYGPQLRAPVGRVHWAGTETATRWNGYLEGAVRAGERAAAEVLAV
ncbi:flavin monoamine oxidase family protein [Micromonospora sp. LH3U1]|uniref:flavin monoamine oxidase family protein n=1 Tax=Micromonospora sp. LH3U1 TaxID=3018339 RepID=UPI00234AE476|nr:FAD-dependent oxidoreductase [Micromonospora sp. LH3U1]WCN78934.1 FAD-dependent oxidoreductase [Micromonospora sp. LH3U1]